MKTNTFISSWAVALMVLSGCVADKPAGIIRSSAPPFTESLRLDLGTIAVVSAAKPAAFSFDKARGQIGDAGDGAGDAAARMLIPPNLHDPLAEAAASPIVFALAPFAAVQGAISAQKRLTPDSLLHCESTLVQAMTDLAGQKHFRNSLLSAAAEKTQRHIVPVEAGSDSAADESRADAVLQTEVQELRLERTGKSDSSFALRIKTRTRLVRSADGAVLFDQPAEYRSATGLFLDWTRDESLRKVAETAYRILAEDVVGQLFVATADGPRLAGAGYKKSPLREHQGGVMLARSDSSGAVPVARPVNHRVGATHSLDIYSSALVEGIDMQMPLTRDQAAVGAVKDLTEDVDGLYNHPNVVVSLATIAVVIPFAVWKQGAAVVCGLSPAKLEDANAKMFAATRQMQPHEQLAAEVAQQLAPQIAEPVMLVQGRPPAAKDDFSKRQSSAPGLPVLLPVSQSAANHPASRREDPALDIHVMSAALRGDDGINPPLALCVVVEARWLRGSDGQEVYSCPIHYRSEKRKYTTWAAHDARLLREEMQRCYREVGATLVEDLISRQLVTPKRTPQPALVGN